MTCRGHHADVGGGPDGLDQRDPLLVGPVDPHHDDVDRRLREHAERSGLVEPGETMAEAAARELAERLVGNGNVEVVDGTLRLASDPADVPRLTRELVLAGVAVSEVRPVERTLEDVFLELTGEEGGDHGR